MSNHTPVSERLNFAKVIAFDAGKILLKYYGNLAGYDHKGKVNLVSAADRAADEYLTARIQAEHGACRGKKDLATRAKQLNYDAIHDTVHEMCKDEARHGQIFEGLLKRYLS